MPQLARGRRAVLNDLLDLVESIRRYGQDVHDNNKMAGYVQDVSKDIIKASWKLTTTLMEELKPLLERNEGSPGEIRQIIEEQRRMYDLIANLQRQIDDMNTMPALGKSENRKEVTHR